MSDKLEKPERKKRRSQRDIAQQLVDNRTRAQKNRAKAQEDLRSKFKGNQYIVQLAKCYNEYNKILNEVSLTKTRKSKIITSGRIGKKQKEELIAISAKLDCLKLSIDIIKAKVDLNLKRLKFCVPEIKAIELRGEDGNNPASAFAKAVLAMSSE